MADFKLKKGVDIPLVGKPEKNITNISESAYVKIHPNRIKGIKPKLLIKEGDFVNTGSPLFFDKLNPSVMFISPCTGTINSINFGPRRVIEQITIQTQFSEEIFEQNKVYSESEINSANKDDLITVLTKSGCWTYIRQRPFSKIANPTESPKSVFISGFNTAPHSPDVEFILNQDSNGFQAGINALSKLTDEKIHISIPSKRSNEIFKSLKNVVLHAFSGPHPSGNVGIQIHHIDPINIGEKVWYVDIQDVAAIGKQLLSGKFSTHKYITVSGEGISSPSYIKIRRGSEIKSILGDQLKSGEFRIISGDVLTGDKTELDFGLGYYDSQVTVIPEGGQREFLGWIKPGLNKYTISNTYLSKLMPRKDWSLNTSINGSLRAIIPFGYWEKVLPMDILPQYLVKSIIANDIDEMEQLGIYECDPEDFALCSFVCQSKFPVHQVISDGLDIIEKEG